MSQTRVGAEKLLDAQIIPILAKCDYLDARPEADQSFIGMDSTPASSNDIYKSYRPGHVPSLRYSPLSPTFHACFTSGRRYTYYARK
jgi:nuclear pore complex protein Nup205